MKILIISPNFPYPPNDGGKIVISKLYEHLIANNVEATFLCINKFPPDEQLARKYLVKSENVFYDKEISSPIRLFKSFILNKPVLIYKFYNRQFFKHIKEIVNNNHFDLIHFESLHTAYYALKLLNFNNTPSILRLQNIESQILERLRDNSKNFLMKILFTYEAKKIKALENKIYKEIKNIIFISEQDKIKSQISAYETNPFVLTAGVDIDFFDNLANFESTDLLYIGSMDWLPNEKAVLWFIENVFSEILVYKPDIKLYIVGKNPSEKIKSLAAPNIIITGTVEDVRVFIKKCGICIVPIFIGGGMRVKILELMASSKSIITTTIGAEGIIYNKGEDLIIADSKEEFVTQIKTLIDNPSLREKIAVRARKNVSALYGWSSIINEYLAYIKKILKNG